MHSLYSKRALDGMAYINIIILSNLAVVQSLFPSNYTFDSRSFFCDATSPLSFQRFTIFSGEKGEGALKETGERYGEKRVMNLPAVCNTLRFVGSSLVSDPNLMRQDSFFAVPTHPHARVHTPPPTSPSPLSQESCTTPLFLAVCP